MMRDLRELQPYKSFILARIRDRVKLEPVISAVLDDVEKLLTLDGPGAHRLVERSDPRRAGELSVGFLHYVEDQRVTWVSDPAVVDHINHLVLVCRRKRHVAIFLSDPRWREAITRRFDKPRQTGIATLQHIPRGILNAAFMKGATRTLWLSSVHRRTSLKADSKILSGRELRDALDPLDDQSYYFTAARCLTKLEDKSMPIGVAPRSSRVWIGATNDWDEFRETVTLLLAYLETCTVPENAPLPIIAVPTSDARKVEAAFDVGLMPPEILADDPSIDPLSRQEMERWAYHTDLQITETDGPDLKANISLGGMLLGTVNFTVDTQKPGGVTLRANGQPDSELVRELHAEAIRACNRPSWVKIWYESGHTLSQGELYEMRHRDVPFLGFRWIHFADTHLDVEKPSPLDLKTIGTKKSLFCWIKNNWPITRLGSNRGGWLACDDGSMEIADFIHLDEIGARPKLVLIHVKGAGSRNPDRAISVSKYEVVTGQAVKNLRHLDWMLLDKGLNQGSKKMISKLVWHNRSQGTRKEMLTALRAHGALCERHVVILQPHVTKKRWEYAQKNPKCGDAARLRQLDTLLLSAEAACHALGARLTVIGAV